MCVWDLWTEFIEEVHAEVCAGMAGACSICTLIGGGLCGKGGPGAQMRGMREGDTGYGEGNKLQRHKRHVVSTSGDRKMILWDIKSGERVRTFEGHDHGLACIEFKGDFIISSSNDCKIKIWSASTGMCLHTLVGHKALVHALAFDPSSRRLVWDLGALCGVGSGSAASASAGGGSGVMRVVRDSYTSHIFDVKFDGRWIVSMLHDQKIVILDFSAGLGVDADFVV
ncbi:WD40-repeat-containing domain protein [Mycena albidolilacea]|uniref:WD40-repeat-containing domain protein n=1 Tax=Mycena albidolilacea TaxID=1033008 RepID=A0AAD7EHY7_9AGAR|nr:WD40-repeat-containing domain protein [Mycena albidolilacea]